MYAVQEMPQYWSKSTTHKPHIINGGNNTGAVSIIQKPTNGHNKHQKTIKYWLFNIHVATNFCPFSYHP